MAELSVCPLLSVLPGQQVSQFLQSCAKKLKWCMCGLTIDQYLFLSVSLWNLSVHQVCALSLHKGNVTKWRKHTKQIQSLEAEVLCSPVAWGAQQYSRVSLFLWVCLHVPVGAFEFWTLSRQCAEIQSLCVLQNILCRCYQSLVVGVLWVWVKCVSLLCYTHVNVTSQWPSLRHVNLPRKFNSFWENTCAQ